MKKNITETRMALIKLFAGCMPPSEMVAAAKIAEAYIFGVNPSETVADIDREPSPFWRTTAAQAETQRDAEAATADAPVPPVEPCGCPACEIRRLLENEYLSDQDNVGSGIRVFRLKL